MQYHIKAYKVMSYIYAVIVFSVNKSVVTCKIKH